MANSLMLVLVLVPGTFQNEERLHWFSFLLYHLTPVIFMFWCNLGMLDWLIVKWTQIDENHKNENNHGTLHWLLNEMHILFKLYETLPRDFLF